MIIKANVTKRRFLFQYMVCSLIPIIAMLIIYFQSKNVIFNNAYEANEQMLRQNISIVETGVQEIKRTANYLLLDQSIVSFLRTDNPLVNGKTVSYVCAGQKTLASMMSSNNMIKNISVYAIKNDMLISSEAAYIRMDDYYEQPNRFGGMSEIMWRAEMLQARHDNELYCIGDGDVEDRQLLYVQSYPSNRTEALVGNLMIKLDTEKILSYFQNSLNGEQGTIFIFDEQGNLIIDNAPSDEYRESVTSLISENMDRRIIANDTDSLLLTDMTGSITGWRFLSAVPVERVLNEVDHIQFTLAIFIFIAVGLGMSLSIVFAIKTAKPINNLMQLVSQQVPVEEIRNDSEFLQQTIRELVDSNRFLKNEMAQSAPSLRIALFYRLLSGDFDSMEDISSEFGRVGVMFNAKLYAVLIIVINDVKPDAPSDEVIRIKLLLDEAVREIIEGVMVEYDMDLEKQAIVISGDYSSPGEFIEYIEGASKEIYDRMLNTFNISVSFGGDLCENIEHIHNCYLSSKQALDYHDKVHDRLVLWYRVPESIVSKAECGYREEVPAQNQRADEIKAYLRANYTNPNISLAQVADHFGITEVYLSRMFKERTGVNFSKEIERLRMEHARYLIETSDMPIYEVAEQSGYSSSQVFRRVYKRVYGEVPSEHIRNNS